MRQQQQPKLVPVSVATLRRGTTYITPSGRLCRLAPPGRGQPGFDGRTFVFEYVDGRHSAPFQRDSFDLGLGNIGLLNEVRP